jgi:hypothetical protein
MPPTYRVRFVPGPSNSLRSPAESRTIEVGCTLDQVPGQLPAAAYIISIEDLAVGRDVHWTRWPDAFRPGFGEHARAATR